jgi:hypothetical protein
MILRFIYSASLVLLFSCDDMKNARFLGNSTINNQGPSSNDGAWSQDGKVESYASDPEALSIEFFPGHAFDSKHCETSPEAVTLYAQRLIPFSYCIRTNVDAGYQPKYELYLGFNDPNGNPERGAEWEQEAKLEKLILLRNGRNHLTLHVRDDRGNEAHHGAIVHLNLGEPPQIDLISPASHILAHETWAAGQSKTLVWRVTDNDTPFEKLRVIFSLTNLAGTRNYFPIGCNFANTRVANRIVRRLCPEGAVENFAGITTDPSKSEFRLTFTLPQNYNYNEDFVVHITAIDAAGNAATASTQEINTQGRENIAGRAYRGNGGSGITIAPDPSVREITSDSHGNVYLPNLNIKVDSDYYRFCKMLRFPGQMASISDCSDIIESEFTVDADWHYVPPRSDGSGDLFYARGRKSGANHLVEINFNTRTVKSLSGDKSKRALNSSSLATMSDVAEYNLHSINSRMFFETQSGLLFFKLGSQMFSMSREKKIRFAFGKAASGVHPSDAKDKEALDIEIPPGNHYFVVTQDYLFLMGGTKLDFPTQRNGSGRGMQYVLAGYDPNVESQKLSLFRISLDNPNIHHPNNTNFHGLSYDPRNRQAFFGIWHGLFKMDLPKEHSTVKSDYMWTNVTRGTGPAIVDVVVADEKSSEPKALPREFNAYINGVNYAGSGLVYFTESRYGYVVSLDLNTGIMHRVFGYSMGIEQDQLAMNLRLDTPRFLSMDKENRLLITDLYHLSRVKMSITNQPSELEILAKNFPNQPYVYDSISNSLYQVVGNSFREHDYTKKPLVSTSYAFSKNLSFGYEIQYALGKKGDSIYSYAWTSTYNGQEVGHSFLNLRSFVLPPASLVSNRVNNVFAERISRPDGVHLNHKGISAPQCDNNCQQGSINNRRIASNQYRLPAVSPRYHWRSAITHTVIDPLNENRTITCLPEPPSHGYTFALVSQSAVQFFDIFHNTQRIGCGLGTVFYERANRLYFGSASGIYVIEFSDLTDTVQKVVAKRVMIQSGFPTSANITGLFVDNNYVYYSDSRSNSVYRNRRIGEN